MICKSFFLVSRIYVTLKILKVNKIKLKYHFDFIFLPIIGQNVNKFSLLIETKTKM